jgi:hypothetical protein
MVRSSRVGANPAFSGIGDLAGFTQVQQIGAAAPELGSLAMLPPLLGTVGMAVRSRRR